jgi:exonuclease III
MPSQRIRILLYNVGYATALDGSMRSYLLHFYRYLYTPRVIIRRVRQAIYRIMETEKPDVCCFVEIHSKLGTVPHPHAYGCSDIANKYGPQSVLRRLPFFRDNCNGFFATDETQFTKTYFKNGTKKLIYELHLPHNFSLFLVHFALERRVRQRQCLELREMLRGRRNVILCGDFNIFKGTGELEELATALDLRIVNTPNESTFPAAAPRMTLDLFLCPKDVKDAHVKVLKNVHASDHLPVLLEMEMA